MAGLRAVAALALVACLPACGGLGDDLFGADAATESAHAVFLTQAGCPYVVANQTRNQFAVLAPPRSVSPLRQGTLLVGDLREGRVELGVVPVDVQEITQAVMFDVAGHSLDLAEAQDLYYGFCPLPPEEIPPGTPGLPLAPDVPPAVPPDVPPDGLPDADGVF